MDILQKDCHNDREDRQRLMEREDRRIFARGVVSGLLCEGKQKRDAEQTKILGEGG